MMIHECFELHNVAEVKPSPNGLKMYRFPRTVCDVLEPYGRYVSQNTTGCEIRFVMEGDRALISLSAVNQDGYVQIYRGDFRYYTGFVYSYPIRKGEVTHIELLKDPKFESLDPSLKRKAGGFSPDVWRIMSDINFSMTLVDFESYGGNVRPPRPDEVLDKTLLCYGTSLTYGACASAQSICSVQLLGRMLNVNILNKGMGGSCMNETPVADYLAIVPFDALLLENAVNMGARYEEYEQRTTYLLDKITAAKPSIPIYMMTCYPNSSVAQPGCAYPVQKRQSEDGNLGTDQIIRRLAKQYPQVHLLEGIDLLNEMTALTCDLVHLSDYGQIMAATNLAHALQGDWCKPSHQDLSK